MPTPPKEVHLSPHTYRVVLVPDGVLDDTGRYGHASIQRLVVALDDGQPTTQMADTLLHELSHGMLASLGLDDELEERVALVLGPALLRLVFDNPELIDYLQSVALDESSFRSMKPRSSN